MNDMTEILKTMVSQTPSLVGFLFLVYLFVKHLEKRDVANRQLHDEHIEERRVCREVINGNVSATNRYIAEMERNCAEKRRNTDAVNHLAEVLNQKSKVVALGFALLLLTFTAYAATNDPAASGRPPMDKAGTYLDQVVQWDAKLWNLPFGAMTFVGMFLVSGLLFYSRKADNRNIPFWAILGAEVFLLLLAPVTNDLGWRLWVGKNLLMGIIIGTLAWAFALKFLKPVADKYRDRGDTQIFGKGAVAPNPADKEKDNKP